MGVFYFDPIWVEIRNVIIFEPVCVRMSDKNRQSFLITEKKNEIQ